MRRARKIFIHLTFLVLGVALGAMALPLILAGDIYEYQDTVDGVHLPEIDAIVCLAGGRGRIAAAGDLWYRYREDGLNENPVKNPPLLYISGMGPQSTWTVFVRQLRAGVRPVIRPEQVYLETESTNTESNALWLARFAEKRGWKRILLLTSPYHMKRASYIFDRTLKSHGLTIQIQTLSALQEPFGEGEWRGSLHGVHVTVGEYMKWIYYKYFWSL
jgi:uncharacterized SAM-binding protein YcdF (DUF218 family)